MKKIFFGLLPITIILICTQFGWLDDICNFFAWLFVLPFQQPEISYANGIVVDVITWSLSYALVGAIFKGLGFFDKDYMKIVYFIISTLMGFVLSHVFNFFEIYGIYILAGIVVVGMVTLLVYIIYKIIRKCVIKTNN